MNSKQVSQLDAEGYFSHTTTADESPLEPGVYMIPGGCVDAPAPEIGQGQRAQWTGASWRIEDIPQPEPEPEPEPTPLPELKAQALKAIDNEHQNALLQLTGNPTQAEQTTWAGKVALAEAIQSGATLSAAQSGFMNAMGIPLAGYAPYAQAVLAKSAQYWTLVGMADKVRSDCKARIEAAQTEAELEQANAANAAQRDQTLAALVQ